MQALIALIVIFGVGVVGVVFLIAYSLACAASSAEQISDLSLIYNKRVEEI